MNLPALNSNHAETGLGSTFVQTLTWIFSKKELPLPIGRKATLEAPNETLYRRSGVCDASYHN